MASERDVSGMTQNQLEKELESLKGDVAGHLDDATGKLTAAIVDRFTEVEQALEKIGRFASQFRTVHQGPTYLAPDIKAPPQAPPVNVISTPTVPPTPQVQVEVVS